MSVIRRRPILMLAILVAGIIVLFVGGFGYYLADSAGKLPWQEDPTRIAITPVRRHPRFRGCCNGNYRSIERQRPSQIWEGQLECVLTERAFQRVRAAFGRTIPASRPGFPCR